MHSLLESDTSLEGIRILGPSLLDGLVTSLTRKRSIPTVRAIASRTETLRSETFAIQLEAFGLFAIAGTCLGRACFFALVLLSSRRRNLLGRSRLL